MIKKYLLKEKQCVAYHRAQFLGHYFSFSTFNDIPLSLPNSQFKFFADVSNILFSHRDPEQFEKI